MRKPRRYYVAPELPQGPFYLNPNGPGFFSVVVPIARTNLVTNPSVETNTTGYTAISTGSIGRGAGTAYHGAYGLSVSLAPGSVGGVYYGPITLTAGTTYAVSVKFRTVTPGLRYVISVATTGAVELVTYEFTGTGRWQWVWVYWTETSTTTRRLYVHKNDARPDPSAFFYIDGLQCEVINAGETVSTYIDGDQQGLLPNQYPPPYRWNGTPHASTSTRDVTTRAGGYVMNLNRFRFLLMAYMGLGVTLVANIATVSAGADGSTFQATVANTRNVALRGRFEASTSGYLDQLRSDLYNIVGPDSAAPRQPLTLLYQKYEGVREAGDFGRIIASYQSGLEEIATPLPAEDATITFMQYLPAIYTNDSGVALAVQSSVTNANDILQRSPAGVWSAMGTGASTGASKVVRAIVVGIDGSIYAGGDFDTMGGVANTSKVAKWDPVTQAWSALSTGITGGSVFALAVGPDGTLYAGGNFTTSSGTPTANISKWNGSAWSTVGTSGDIGAQVSALAVDQTGNLYVAGLFSNAGGVAAADFVVKRTTAGAWSALGASSFDNTVNALTIGLDNRVYLSGVFINYGATAMNGAAVWDGTAVSALSTGIQNSGLSVGTGIDGRVYFGGSFTVAGGITANASAVWNGSGFTALGTGLNGNSNAIEPELNGTIWWGGSFTTANGFTLPDGLVRWNGGTWIAADVDLPGSASVQTIAVAPASGVLYVGYNTTGTATAAGVTTATNDGTAITYPTVAITGPSSGTSRIYQLLNATTGKLIYMNLTMNAGETVTLRTSPGRVSMTSSFRGDVSSAILSGSSPDFFLAKGSNSISFFAAGSTVTALMSWTTAFQSASDLTN